MVDQTLKDVQARLDRLEKAVFGNHSARVDKKSRGSTTRSLPAHIMELRSKDYFKEPRTAGEVHRKLTPSYHCELDRVATALLRLKNKKRLRKAAKKVGKKEQVAYVW